MNCTIDASVFVSATRREEENFPSSREFVRRISTHTLDLFCPTLIIPETAAAIAKATANPKAAEQAVMLLGNLSGLHLVGLDASLAQRAAKIAIEQQLRGADSIYAAVAQVFDAILITWDYEMQERGGRVVQTMTPAHWLDQTQDR